MTTCRLSRHLSSVHPSVCLSVRSHLLTYSLLNPWVKFLRTSYRTFWKRLTDFNQILHGAFCRKVIDCVFERFGTIECYDRALLPSIICLGRLRIASKYIFNLWQLRQGVDSLAQWLEHWIFNREDPGSIPRKDGIFFQLCFIPLLRLSCRKMGARPGLDFISPKMASRHHKWWLPWRGGVLRPSTPTFDYLPWQITHSF